MTTPRSEQGLVAVLHVFSYFNPDFTGEGIYLTKLMRHLHAAGVSGDVVAARSRGVAPEVTDGHSRVWYFGRGDRSAGFANLRMLWWLAFNLGRYDVVHFHAWVDRYLLCHLLAKLFGRPVVHSCTLDDSISHVVGTYRPAYRPLMRRLVRLIDKMIAISPRLRDECEPMLPLGRTEFVPQGVDMPTGAEGGSRDDLRHIWGLGPGDIALLFVGGLCERKDVGFLLEQHTEVLTRCPRARLIIVGPDLENDYADALRARANAISGDRIRFVGFMANPEDAYRVADIFVFASRSEGFGNVLVEAMAHGLAVVSRRLPGVTDAIVDDGSTGYLFDNPSGYVAHVGKLAADPELRNAIGVRARDAVRTRFGLKAAAVRYERIYRALVGRRHRGAASP
jgi:glycosyltransferase involved in cell wall biosynthesis